MTLRIAMWSGPRNLSTAMMRAFENRPDCTVVDEPFYAAYLLATGIEHPMRDAVLAAQPTDWRQVVAALTGDAGAPVIYEKHMTHHMLPRFGRGWIGLCRNAFLIRAPAPVLVSYAARRERVTLSDIGFREQAALFDQECDRLGHAPPVIDAADVRARPEAMLRLLCAALGIAFMPEMLRWPAGPRDSDGVWGPAWYGAVQRSTGFAPPDGAEPGIGDLTADLRRVAEAADIYYQRLRPFRMIAPA